MRGNEQIINNIAFKIIEGIELTSLKAEPIEFTIIPGTNLSRIAINKTTADLVSDNSDKKWGLYRARDGKEIFLENKTLKAYNVPIGSKPISEETRENLVKEISDTVEKILKQSGLDPSSLSPHQIDNIIKASGQPLKGDTQTIMFEANKISEEVKKIIEEEMVKEIEKIKKILEEEVEKKKQEEERQNYAHSVAEVVKIEAAKVKTEKQKDALIPLPDLLTSKDLSTSSNIAEYEDRRLSRIDNFKFGIDELRNIELANDKVVKRTVTKAQVLELKNAQDVYERLIERQKLGIKLSDQEQLDLDNAKNVLDNVKRQLITNHELVQHIIGNKVGLDMLEKMILEVNPINKSELATNWRSHIKIEDNNIVILPKDKTGKELTPVSISTQDLKKVWDNMINVNNIDSDLSSLDTRNEKVLAAKMAEARDKLEVMEANEKKLALLSRELQARKQKLVNQIEDQPAKQSANLQKSTSQTSENTTNSINTLLDEVTKLEDYYKTQKQVSDKFKTQAFSNPEILKVVKVQQEITTFNKTSLKKVETNDRSKVNLEMLKEEFTTDQQAKGNTKLPEKHDKWQKHIKGEQSHSEDQKKNQHPRINHRSPTNGNSLS